MINKNEEQQQFRWRIVKRTIIKYDKIKKRKINSGFTKIKSRIIFRPKAFKNSGITLRRNRGRRRRLIKFEQNNFSKRIKWLRVFFKEKKWVTKLIRNN